jgi:DNA-binding NarL/FixJ family response regulator
VNAKTKTVFIADDSEALRVRLVEALAEIPGLKIAGQAGDIDEAIQGIRATQPDIVVLDVHFPRGSGLAVLASVKTLNPPPVVLVLTNHNDAIYRWSASAAGAKAFIDTMRQHAQST